MTSFSDLPDEVVYEMCKDWDTPTLLNMSQSHGRVYQICYGEIQKRKKAAERAAKIKRRMEIDTVREELQKGTRNFIKFFPNGIISEVTIIRGTPPHYDGTVQQIIYSDERNISQEEAEAIPTLVPFGSFAHLSPIKVSDFSSFSDYDGYLIRIEFFGLETNAVAANLVDQKYVIIK